MEQNAKQNKLPLLGMIVTTALVLGALCALLWWSTHRWSVYARRAMAAAARQDWAAAESWGQKAESAGAADVLNEIAAQKADALFESGPCTGRWATPGRSWPVPTARRKPWRPPGI